MTQISLLGTQRSSRANPEGIEMDKNACWNLKEAVENAANEVRQPTPLAIWLGGNPLAKTIVSLVSSLSTFGWTCVDNHTDSEIKYGAFVIAEVGGELYLCPASADGFSINPIMHRAGVRPFLSQGTVGGFIPKTRHAFIDDRFAKFNRESDPVCDGRILIYMFENQDLSWTVRVI
jgi:hypothetical protein